MNEQQPPRHAIRSLLGRRAIVTPMEFNNMPRNTPHYVTFVFDWHPSGRLADDTLSLAEDWDETQHPRDNGGRFATKEGEKNATQRADATNNRTATDATPAADAKKAASPAPVDWGNQTMPPTIGTADWTAMKDALDKRRDLTDIQKYNILSLYGWEGGLKKDSKGTIAGLLRTTLKDMGEKTPKSAAEVINLYQHYFDDAMHTVGGKTTADKIGDAKAGAAFVDTMFRHGVGAGAKVIQQAINDVREKLGQPKIAEGDGMGPETLEAYRALLKDPETRQALLDALAKKRIARATFENHGKAPPGDIVRAKSFQ